MGRAQKIKMKHHIESDDEFYRALATAANSPPKRILFVEDERPVRDAFVALSRRYYVDIDMASSGAAALSKFDSNSYGIIILDLRLPDMGGEEVLKKIRERDRKVIVAIMSAYIDSSVRRSLAGYSPFAYIEKPENFTIRFIEEFFHQLEIPKLTPDE